MEDDESFEQCRRCGDEHPEGVLEDGYCPACCDEEDEVDLTKALVRIGLKRLGCLTIMGVRLTPH